MRTNSLSFLYSKPQKLYPHKRLLMAMLSDIRSGVLRSHSGCRKEDQGGTKILYTQRLGDELHDVRGPEIIE